MDLSSDLDHKVEIRSEVSDEGANCLSNSLSTCQNKCYDPNIYSVNVNILLISKILYINIFRSTRFILVYPSLN